MQCAQKMARFSVILVTKIKNEKIFIFLLDKLLSNLYNIFIFKDLEGNKIHNYSAKRAVGRCETV